MKKGDIVIVKARVETTYDTLQIEHEVVHMPPPKEKGLFTSWEASQKYLARISEKETWTGMVVGYTFRYTGYGQSGHSWDIDESSNGSLTPDKSHKVWLVESIGDDRWTEPVTCLEEDLRIVEGER